MKKILNEKNLRMEENNEVFGDMRVPGKRPRGRPRGRWMDGVQRDMQTLRITPEDAQDRTFWKSRIQAADPTLREKAKKKNLNICNFGRSSRTLRMIKVTVDFLRMLSLQHKVSIQIREMFLKKNANHKQNCILECPEMPLE